jgi:transglutaminase-like putative cysteine protease
VHNGDLSRAVAVQARARSRGGHGEVAEEFDFKLCDALQFCAFALRFRNSASRTAVLMLVLAGCGLAQTTKPAPSGTAATPPDAVVLVWDQQWTLTDDHSIVYHEKRHVLLNHERAYGEFVDPRITYDKNTQTVEVIVARTKRRDGKYVELPPYSRTEVAPNGAAGWPALAGIQQVVLVLSGVEAGCIVELEYRVTTKPRPEAVLAGDVRIVERYPVVSRQMRFEVPRQVDFAPVLSGIDQDQVEQTVGHGTKSGLAISYTFANLAGVPNEPYSLPWQQRAPRLAFSTAGPVEQWLGDRTRAITEGADDSQLIQKLAGEWTKGAATSGEKVRAIQEKLAAAFNFVEFDAACLPGARRASETLSANYGVPVEAASVLLALGRAAGVTLRPVELVWNGTWVDDAPQAGLVGADLLALESGDSVEYWSAQHGRVQRDKRWNDATILSATDGEVKRVLLPAWSDPEASRVNVAGAITVGEDGNATGKLSIRQSGMFLNPGGLRSQDAQGGRVREVVRRVFPALEVASFTIRSLSDDGFEAEAQVKTSKPLEKIAESWRVSLGQDGPAWADVAAPLAYGRVEGPVRLAGAFVEQVELQITWPGKWSVDARPTAVEKVAGAWGEVDQRAKVDGSTLTLSRTTRLNQRDLEPAAMKALRDGVNALRAEKSRTLLLRP